LTQAATTKNASTGSNNSTNHNQFLTMKHLLLTTIAAVVLVGCGNPEADRALIDATEAGDIESIKQHLAAGADVNASECDG